MLYELEHNGILSYYVFVCRMILKQLGRHMMPFCRIIRIATDIGANMRTMRRERATKRSVKR